jgi:hypothetical protein
MAAPNDVSLHFAGRDNFDPPGSDDGLRRSGHTEKLAASDVEVGCGSEEPANQETRAGVSEPLAS